MAIRDSNRPLTSLLTQVVSEVAYLLQTEIRLARAEISEKLGRAASGSAMLAIAAVLSLCGLIVLLMGAVRWLEIAGVPNQWGFLIVGGAVLIIGVALALFGTRNLSGSSLKPQRTIDQVRADFSVAKEHV
jgi:hypothetical protein